VAEFRELSGLLASQHERVPPAELKQRLRERIASEKSVELAPPAVPGTPRGSLWTLALGIGLAATLLLSVGLFFQTGALRRTLADREEQLARRERTLNALLEPGVQLTTLTATGDAPPIVQVFWNRPGKTLVLNTFRLQPVPAGRVYQLWLMPKNGKPIPSITFNTESTGHQLVEAVSVPSDTELGGFALTVEPEGGSPQPTSAPILFGSTGG
jgi:anti-sigma-K factor RskA